MERHALRESTAGALLLALAFLLPPAAWAERPTAEPKVKEIKRLGGPNRFFPKDLKTEADLMKMLSDRKADIEAVFTQAGWPGRPEDFFRAFARGEHKEVEVPVGAELQWMAMRKMGKPQVLSKVRWAGKAPFPAWEASFVSNDVRHVFVIPRVCGNFALVRSTPEPAPVCRLTVKPASDCISRPVTIDASGSTIAHGQIRDVEVNVTIPDGRTEKYTSANQTARFQWTRSWAIPGRYQVQAVAVADTGRRSEPCQAAFELKPCPPSCRISLSVEEVLAGEPFTVDVSASKAEVGEMEVVTVDVVDEKGATVSTLELRSPFTAQTSLKAGGHYTFRAVAKDTLGQTSTEACEAKVHILPRNGVVLDFLGGTERRWRDEFPTDRSAGLVGGKFGVNHMFNQRFEFIALFGGAFNVRDNDNSSLFVDLEIDYRGERGFFGGGIGGWDINHFDTADGDAIVHGGIFLPWKTRGHPVALIFEGRLFLSMLEEIDNNYLVWAGLRFHLHN